ncbi:MAG: DNA polymerase III subunit alpha, partial [Actinomycetota bacterium]
MSADSFVHLHVHTEYSILDGAARIRELVADAAAAGMPAIAMTDHGNMYAALEFYKACGKAGVKPILGAELYVATRSRFEKSSRERDGSRHLTVLAQNEAGYRNLMRIVSAGHLEGFFYRPRVDKEILARHHEGIVALSGCLASEVNEHLKAGDFEQATSVAGEYAELFGRDNYYIELQDHGLEEQRKVFPQLVDIAKRIGVRTVATNDLHYTKQADADAHDVLLCIQTNSKINEPNRFKFDGREFYLKSPAEMRELFRDHPQACDATLDIAERCELSIEFDTLHLPPFTPPTGETQEAYLRRLVEEGARERYGDQLPTGHRERIEHELNVICSMGFAGYFLIVADLIGFARSRGIRVGPGRGSAAGCVVSYCLRITDLDPLQYGLIFERFLNPERRQMPDIDMDFDERRRGEVIRYVTERYGEDRVAQIITFGTIKGKQAIRDAARVLDLPYTFGDRLAKMYPPAILGREAPLAACFDPAVAWPDADVARNDAYANASDLRTAYGEDEISRQVIDIARSLEGLRRQVSVHAAGVVIADRPLVEYVPLKRADEQNGGGIVTQYEMGGVEALGLLKMDFLGLRNLTVLTDTELNVRRTRGVELDVDAIPLDDAQTFDMLAAGETVGVFQLESGGMRELVKRLKPDRFEDVMALVALYRPGPLGQGMHVEYAERKHGRRRMEYLHPDLQPILEETFGIILYQEQALRIAVEMAGFTMAEADTLRKAIGKKIAAVMRAQREKFVAGCSAKGYSEELAKKLWSLIDEFSGYGFNRCLIGSTRIPCADTGRVWTIRDLFKEGARIRVSSLSQDGAQVSEPIGEVWFNGVKPVYRLRTRLGREIVTTGNHPFYTIDGWRTLVELRPGDKIAAVRRLPAGSGTWPRHRLATLGWVLSEGNTCHPSGFYLYTKSAEQAEDMIEAVSAFEATSTTVSLRRDLHEIYVRSDTTGDGRFGSGRTRNDRSRSGARLWLESLGLTNCAATSKFVPPEVFELRHEDLAVFVGRLWSGDGFVSNHKDKFPFYATSSSRLAGDVQDLLLRLGILSRVGRKSFKYRGGTKPGYTVHVLGPASVERFVEVVGPHLIGRAAQLDVLVEHLATRTPDRTSRDTVPVSVCETIRALKVGAGVRWRDIEAATGLSMRAMSSVDPRKQGYRRSTLKALAEYFGSGELRRLAADDIFWDSIVSIEPAGEEETFDLEVPGTHNFVAEGLYVHNSHSCGYALIAYQTAYLKAHYSVEYFAALLSSVKGNQDRSALYLAECRALGITVNPPDVNASESDYAPSSPGGVGGTSPTELGGVGGIRFGLSAIRNIGENVVATVVHERNERGPFTSFADFCQRVDPLALNKRVLESLVKAGAFDSLWEDGAARRSSYLEWGTDKRTGLQTLGLSEPAARFAEAAADDRRKEAEGQSSLFGAEERQRMATAAEPTTSGAVIDRSDLLRAEKEMLGLYVSDHPLLAVEASLSALCDARIVDLEDRRDGEVVTIGGIVARSQRKFTKKGEPMGVLMIEDLAGAIEVVVFPSTFASLAQDVIAPEAIVCVKGKIDLREDPAKIVAQEVWRPALEATGPSEAAPAAPAAP